MMIAESLKADGFDEAILGEVTLPITSQMLLVYSVAKCIGILIDRDGMSYEEAEEFFDFNVRDAYVGEGTPLWLDEYEVERS